MVRLRSSRRERSSVHTLHVETRCLDCGGRRGGCPDIQDCESLEIEEGEALGWRHGSMSRPGFPRSPTRRTFALEPRFLSP